MKQSETVYYVMNAVMALANAIMFTTYAVYYVIELGLDPLQMILVGTFLELTIFLLEIPTGVMADTYSRRLSVILAFFIMGFAFVLEGSIPLIGSGAVVGGLVSGFGMVVLAEVIRGVGETFLSGARQAWIADEAGEQRIGPIFVRSNQIQQIASVCGILISVALASMELFLPFLAGGTLYLLLAVYLILAMKEDHFQPVPRDERNSWRQMQHTLREGVRVVRGHKVLMLILGVTLFAGAGSEAFDRLWEVHFMNEIGLPPIAGGHIVVWFGIFGITGMLLGAVMNEGLLRRVRLENTSVIERLLVITTMLRIACIVSFGVSGNFAWAVVSFFILGMANAVFSPLYETWLNRNIQSRSRATVLSMMSQSDAVGQTAGGPGVGWIGTRYTVRASIVLSAVLLMPMLSVFWKVARREG